MSEPTRILVHYEAFWPEGGSTKYARRELDGGDVRAMCDAMCLHYYTYVALDKITASVDGQLISEYPHPK